jgi:antitoxin (DNA-binding transcriptional repressor) of toxin-antitoxin stability system
VERGESYVVTRYRRVIARLVPAESTEHSVGGADVTAAMARTPLTTDWAAEIDADRDSDIGTDPWGER